MRCSLGYKMHELQGLVFVSFIELNMVLYLQKFINRAPCAPQLYSLAETPQPSDAPPPTFGLIYEGAIGQLRETKCLCDPLVLCIEHQKHSKYCGVACVFFVSLNHSEHSNVKKKCVLRFHM